MPYEDKLTEQITIAAEGIKQLVEQGKKTLSATEHLARGGLPSSAARAFAQVASSPAGAEFFEAGASGAVSRTPAISHAVQSGVTQIQAASQPQARRTYPESFEAIQARMLHAVNIGADPAVAARVGGGIPLGPSQWPAGMPGLPVGSPGNPAPPGMPPLPTPAVPAPPSPRQAGGGFFDMPSLGRTAIAAGTGLGIARLITSQTVGEFSAGHGLPQWNAEAAAGAAHVSSLSNLLLQGAKDALEAANKARVKTLGPLLLPNGQQAQVGDMPADVPRKESGGFFDPSNWWMKPIFGGDAPPMSDDVEHKHESGKTSVGDGPL